MSQTTQFFSFRKSVYLVIVQLSQEQMKDTMKVTPPKDKKGRKMVEARDVHKYLPFDDILG